MSRPKHLNTPNTPEGIRRINELQREYDKDPEAYERKEREREEERQMEERRQYEEWLHQQNRHNHD